ncbi:hypothetical protein ACVW16_004167 [Bradyrhizobium sp. USDA 4474]
MTLPQWLIQLGSIGGLLSFSVTAWDRLFSERPLVWISPSEYGSRNLHFKNMSKSDVTIRKIKCLPAGVGVSEDDSIRSIAKAAIGDSFVALLRTEEESQFPIIFRRGELFDEDNREMAPFCILVFWRNQSQWLPQIPKVIFSSVRTLRLLQKAKKL